MLKPDVSPWFNYSSFLCLFSHLEMKMMTGGALSGGCEEALGAVPGT